MAGKIYAEKTEWCDTQDSDWVANEYDQQISELAKAVSKIKEVRERFKFLQELTKDNGDPSFELEEVFPTIATALAIAIEYRDEYRKEAAGESI